MYSGWTLLDAELERQRRTMLGIFMCAALLMAFFGGMCAERANLTARHQTHEAEIVAQKDAEITEKEVVITEKDAVIAAREAEIRKIRARAVTLDENGVRTNRMSEIYLTSDPYRESEIQTDAEFREYCRENCPEAVLPTDEWTTENVIESWLATPEIWGVWRDSYNDLKTYFVWTADYEHCFYLDMAEPISPTDYETGEHRELVSGWLVMDGVRIVMLDAQTYDVDDPYEMLRQYQSGEWDGSTRRSHDGSTVVEVDGLDGNLEYHYEAWRYDQTTDPLGLAYVGYADEPWWKRDDLPEELLAAVGERNRYATWDDTKTRGSSWLWVWDFYADLPGGISAQVEGLGELYDTVRTRRGTFFVASTGVWLYKQGQLVDDPWLHALDKESAELYMRCVLPKTPEEIAALDATVPPPEDDGVVRMSEQQRAQEYADGYAACEALGLVTTADQGYVYTGKTLLVLREGGEIEPLFDQMVTTPGRYSSSAWGLRDGQLIYWRGYTYGSSELPEVVAEGVLEADFTDLALFMKTDGCYEVARVHGENEVRYLGTEEMNYYKEFYQTLRAATYYS